MVRRFERLPSLLVFDGGKEFSSNNASRIMRRYRIDFFERTSKPRGGSLVERMFGITEIQLIQEVAGNIKSRKRGRLNTAEVDASSHAGLALNDEYEFLEEFCFNIYDNRRHPALMMPPRLAYDRSIVKDGVRRPKVVRYDQAFLFETGLDVERSVRIVDPRRGVFHGGRYYTNLEVQTRPSVAGRKQRAREHNFDPATLFVQCDKIWNEFHCQQLRSRITGADVVVQRVLSEELYKLKELRKLSDEQAARELGELIDKANERAARRREDFSQPEDVPFRPEGSTSPSPRGPLSIDEMFKAARARQRDDHQPFGEAS
jgi:putative transposase